jgi:hypothetical protein
MKLFYSEEYIGINHLGHINLFHVQNTQKCFWKKKHMPVGLGKLEEQTGQEFSNPKSLQLKRSE